MNSFFASFFLTVRGVLNIVAPRVAERARIAQLDRALASGAKGRRFESCCAYHLLLQSCAINSVVECHLHTVEVTGSNPVSRTIYDTSVSFLEALFLMQKLPLYYALFS